LAVLAGPQEILVIPDHVDVDDLWQSHRADTRVSCSSIYIYNFLKNRAHTGYFRLLS